MVQKMECNKYRSLTSPPLEYVLPYCDVFIRDIYSLLILSLYCFGTNICGNTQLMILRF